MSCAEHEATLALALERVKKLEEALVAARRELENYTRTDFGPNYSAQNAIEEINEALRPEGT